MPSSAAASVVAATARHVRIRPPSARNASVSPASVVGPGATEVIQRDRRGSDRVAWAGNGVNTTAHNANVSTIAAAPRTTITPSTTRPRAGSKSWSGPIGARGDASTVTTNAVTTASAAITAALVHW